MENNHVLETWKPVLVVDDNPTLGKIVARLLRDIGFKDVIVQTKVLGGMRELVTRPFALVISDIEMEPISGTDFIRLIRRDPATRQLPVLLMTASRALAAKAFSGSRRCLANAMIFKPFTAIELKDKISEILEARFTDESLMPTELAKLNGNWALSRRREMIEETLMARIRNAGLNTSE
jgi:two-component system chemotaxis response regulator CheY